MRNQIMDLKNKIKELFIESMTGADPFSNSGGGGKNGTVVNMGDKDSANRRDDTRRKRVERERAKRLKGKKSGKTVKNEEPIDPRSLLLGEFRFTLKESFINKLIEYVVTRKTSILRDALDLMEEYPQLKKHIIEESKKALPERGFSVYVCRESTLNEEIGSAGERTGNGPHRWYLSEMSAVSHKGGLESYYVMEAKVNPSHTLLYVPAFTKDMEKLILSGKIDEPNDNVLRLARKMGEIVLVPEVNQGQIIRLCQ